MEYAGGFAHLIAKMVVSCEERDALLLEVEERGENSGEAL